MYTAEIPPPTSVVLEKVKLTTSLGVCMLRRVAGRAVCFLVAASVVACRDATVPVLPRALSPEGAEAGKVSGPTDPTATWYIPLSDAALNVRSDHLNGNGTSSVYANGVCNV